MADMLPVSILFRPGDPAAAVPAGDVPRFATDLQLDAIAAALEAGGTRPGVGPRSWARLRDPDAVAFRHEVFRDLESAPLLDAVRAFSRQLDEVAAGLVRAARIALRHERQRWHLEAARTYCAAVPALADALGGASLGSRGLVAVRDALDGYVGSAAFAALRSDAGRVHAALDGVRYRLRIGEHQITVARDDGAADYGAEIGATFARFRQTDARPVEADVFDTVEMNMIEARILDRVARLHPDAFRSLDAFAAAHPRFTDATVVALAGEAAFYLAWLDLVAPLRAAGLPFCYPEVSAGTRTFDARDCFDLALALRRGPAGEGVVTNDVRLADDERFLVITGPNQAGKTTLARAIGQLYHLAGVGCPVPASSARIPLVDAVHTMFARTEGATDLAGRLEAELTEVRDILDGLTSEGVVIVNEGFASTTVDDAVALTRELFAEIAARGAACVAVTFLGELASFDATTVSMACVMAEDDPTRPTFRIARGPANDLAHARALADAHRLDYASVVARVVG